MRKTLLLLMATAALTASAFAQADGPDFFRVTGVKKDDNINVRRRPNADAKIVGKIPKDADGIKNLGCKGGLTEAQFEKASAARKKAAERNRWCEVAYNDVTGWVAARFLAEGSGPKQATMQPASAPPMPAIQASFDCAKAEKNAEKIICGDANLAALDREMARVYALAADGANATPRFEALLNGQNKWLAQRNTCFDKDCVAELSARRIHQLRQAYADARTQDGKGISNGPLAARCAGLDATIGVTFVNSDPGYVYAEWRNEYAVLKSVPSGSGTRFQGNFASFWNKGDEALISLPGGKEMTCKMEKVG